MGITQLEQTPSISKIDDNINAVWKVPSWKSNKEYNAVFDNSKEIKS